MPSKGQRALGAFELTHCAYVLGAVLARRQRQDKKYSVIFAVSGVLRQNARTF